MDFDPHKKANKCEYINEQARISSVNIPLIWQSSIWSNNQVLRTAKITKITKPLRFLAIFVEKYHHISFPHREVVLFPWRVNQRPTDKSTSSPRSICPSLPLHLSSFSLSCHSFRQPFPFLHLPCPFHVRQERLHVRQERPKKGRQEFHLYFSA